MYKNMMTQVWVLNLENTIKAIISYFRIIFKRRKFISILNPTKFANICKQYRKVSNVVRYMRKIYAHSLSTEKSKWGKIVVSQFNSKKLKPENFVKQFHNSTQFFQMNLVIFEPLNTVRVFLNVKKIPLYDMHAVYYISFYTFPFNGSLLAVYIIRVHCFAVSVVF